MIGCSPAANGGGSGGSASGGTSSGTGGGLSGTGGASAPGGATATGGATGSGGATGTGGAPSTGGASATGGNAMASGGAPGTGGAAPTAGTSGTGGRGGAGVAGRIGIGGGGGALGTGGAIGAGGQLACPGRAYDAANPPVPLTLSGSLGTHDPVVMMSGSTYYMFFTGRPSAKTSTNLTAWANGPAVFASNPAWIATSVPGASNLWAPDISYFGGQYHLYYSASTFGQNRSCIGHATKADLATGSWMDHGSVICSNTGTTNDNWNAIDPNVIVDEAGTPWLAFGSFWGGLKLIQLDTTGARVGTTLTSIAARPNNGGALEAPFIIRRCGFYYLFMSFDTCCQGVSSTYNIRVSRATSVMGPYADKAGTPAMMGGGTLLVQGNTTWHGPGHNAVLVSGDRTYNVYHAYNSNAGTLRISEMVWDADGWPVSGGP